MLKNLLTPELGLVLKWVYLVVLGLYFRHLIRVYRRKGIEREVYQKIWAYRFFEGLLVTMTLLTIFITLSFAFAKLPVLPSVSLWFAAILLYSFALGDFLSTRKALKLGARELNSVARLVIAKFGINKLPILSVTVMSLVLVFAWSGAAVSEQYSMLVVLFTVLVSNMVQIRKLDKKAIEREAAKVGIDKEMSI